jgi:molybdenum cofactor cytidylyltransferase
LHDSPPFPPSPPYHPAPLRFGVIILAAGASTRMGSPKQLIAYEGKPLIVRAAEAALASRGRPVVIVLGAHAEQVRPVLLRFPVLVTENPAWSEGMASSIRAGIDALSQLTPSLDAAMIALCDQPAFSAAVVDQLVATQRSTGRAIVAARYSGRLGVPALFLREHFPALGALSGEEGARALINGDPDRVASVHIPELALDLDRPEDLPPAPLAQRPTR